LGSPLILPRQGKRFLREGRLAASVSHPNSVYIYGTEEIDGAPVIAMELAAGGTLRDLIKKRGPLSSREAIDIILQVIAD
jgi:serine/threonine protein kinase